MLNEKMNKEKKLLDDIVKIHNSFFELESQHPFEKEDFTKGIHELQKVIALRYARKYEPVLFPKK